MTYSCLHICGGDFEDTYRMTEAPPNGGECNSHNGLPFNHTDGLKTIGCWSAVGHQSDDLKHTRLCTAVD